MLRLAFCLDGGFAEQVGVEVRQDGGQIHATVYGTAQLAAVERRSEGFEPPSPTRLA